ncbi:MAG TPA: peptide-binding protein, partial [Epsilonproteobacteria bacterium]|nr:peptide-binding protein [Campylobacterota bacterium]
MRIDNQKWYETNRGLFGLFLVAYLFAIAIRFIWVYQFWDNPSVWWNGQMMINTNDGYFFASGVQYFTDGFHADNPRIVGLWHQGLIWITALFVEISPFSLETTIFYMPMVAGSLIVIPLILIGRLYHKPLWGLFAALIGAIAWSYYNRTMVGYYDTDMFVVWVPLLAVYFLMRYVQNGGLQNGLYASLLFVFYGFVYSSSGAVVGGLVVWFALYGLWFHRDRDSLYGVLSLLFVVLLPFSKLTSYYELPWGYLLQVVALLVVWGVFEKIPTLGKRFVALGLFVLALLFGNTVAGIWAKISSYMFTGTMAHGLSFFGVAQTVREASSIDITTLANRIAGSWYGLLIGVAGYLLLLKQYRAFWLLLPLFGVGLFALFGGLRFTIFAVPVVALGAAYLFVWLGEKWLKKSSEKNLLLTIGMIFLLYPNVKHVVEYKVPTVMNNAEVADLEKLKNISNSKDFTLSWWDYGYPLWFYTKTSTLIDGGKHHNDNFILSTLMLSTSSQLVSNLSRLAVEEYVSFTNLMQENAKGKTSKEASLYKSLGYNAVIDVLLANKQDSQKNPTQFLEALADSTYPLPPKTRDIYLYFPIRMLSIFPVVAQFGNIDLTTGRPLREIVFAPTYMVGQKETSMVFHNGLEFDSVKGTLKSGNQLLPISKFVAVDEKLSLSQWSYSPEGKYILLLVKSQGVFVILDKETFDSAFVQMGLLGIYDESLFERVISSPSSQV